MQYNTPFRNRIFRLSKMSSTPKVVANIAIIITWLLLLVPMPSLYTYTSTEALILGKYSPEYALWLVFYSMIAISLPGFLFVNEHSIKLLLRKFQVIVSNLEFYARYISICLATIILLFFLSRLYAWGYDTLLQTSLLIQGLWLVFLPSFILWGINGWSLKYFSMIRFYAWLTGNINVWIGPAIVVIAISLSALLGYGDLPRIQQLILLLILAISIVLLLWHRPLWGIVMIVVTIIIPVNGPSGFNATTALVAFLLGYG